MTTLRAGAALGEPVPDDRLAWLEWRRGGLGSSDAAAIAGRDPFKGPLAVWLDKTGRVPLERVETEYQRWGRLLEDAICQEFEFRTGLVVPPAARQRLFVHPEHPWFRATIDGFVFEAPGSRAVGLLEVKTVAGFKSDLWADGGIPDGFQIQVLHQLGVAGLSHAWIAVLFGGQRLELREFDLAEEDLAALLELEDAFWARVLSGLPPSGDGSTGSTDALRAAYAAGGGGTLTLPIEAGALLLEREQAKADEHAAASRAAAAEQTLMAMLGEAEVGLYDGIRRVTWKRHERSVLDVDALRAKHPALVRRHTTKQPYRALRFVGSLADTGGESL